MRGRTKHNLVRTALGLGLLATGIALGGCELFWLTAPAVPTGIEASDGTHAGQVVVTWNGVARTIRYEVYRADTQGGSYTQLGETTGTVYSDATVIPNTTYWYRVKACNRGGCSELSEPDSGYAQGEGVPEVPTGVSATDGLYTDRVRVTWNASPGATSYEVWRDVAQGGPYSLRGTVAGTTYDDLDASPGVVYWYKVKACNPSGCSAFSAPDSGFTFPSAPDPVTNVSASDGTYTDRVRVTWTASTGAANYEVYRADSEDGTYARRATVTGTSYDDTGVTVGTTYWYKVKACNTAGCSAFSVPDPGFASAGGGGGGGGGGGTGQLPAQPRNVAATDGTHADKIRVTWSSVSGATSYRLYRSNDSTFDITTDRIAETTSTSFDDVHHATNNPLDLCVDYWYAVSAMNATGEGPLSVADAGYRGTRVTGVPTVSATDGVHATKIVLTWNEIKGATTYEVWRAGSFGGPYTKVGDKAEAADDDTNTTVTFEDTTVTTVPDYWEKTFYYRVKAYGEGACGCGGLSAPESGYVRRTPDAPTNVSATDGVHADKVVITWDAAARADRYEVYRATTQTGAYTKIGETTDPTVTFDDATATAGTTYWYKVSACNTYGCGPMSTANSGYRAAP